MVERPPCWQAPPPGGTGGGVRLQGGWSLAALAGPADEPRARPVARAMADLAADPALSWDLRQVERLDDVGALLLWQAWGRRMPARVELRPEHSSLFSELAAAEAARAASGGGSEPDPAAPLVAAGRGLAALRAHGEGALRLVGQLVIDLLWVLRHPSRIPAREISANLYRAGSQALAVTALVGFLIGVVLSYLSGQQLHLFGADIYIVNLLGIAVVRELGPVLAAILVAGRSGSAMTARIGVMRITQELDAMAVMGIPQGRRLILPMAIALALAVPLLCLWTSVLALAGGMLAAEVQMGLSHRWFAESLRTAVPIANLWLGLGKGVVFGVLVALVACHFGLRIRPDTGSLGRGVTASVVTAITVVIVADAAFAVLFSDVGLSP